MTFTRKYNVTLDTTTAGSLRIRIPIRVAGSANFATSSDWTPATGDVKVSQDGGAQANIGTLPSYSNGSWEFTLTGTELSAKQIEVRVVDSATKAVDDEFFNVETFGHASAMWPTDYTATNLAANVKAVSDDTNAADNLERWFDGTVGFGTASAAITADITGTIDQVSGSVGSIATGGISTSSFTAGAIDAAAISADAGAEIADALLDKSAGVETGLTLRQWFRLGASVLFGKSSNGGNTFRDFGDTKARITATVDADFNRTAITRDSS